MFISECGNGNWDKMKIKNDVFYVLIAAKEKHLFGERAEAIDVMKKAVKKAGASEGVNVFSVDVSKDQWEIIGIPWQEIAMELIMAEE